MAKLVLTTRYRMFERYKHNILYCTSIFRTLTKNSMVRLLFTKKTCMENPSMQVIKLTKNLLRALFIILFAAMQASQTVFCYEPLSASYANFSRMIRASPLITLKDKVPGGDDSGRAVCL